MEDLGDIIVGDVARLSVKDAGLIRKGYLRMIMVYTTFVINVILRFQTIKFSKFLIK